MRPNARRLDVGRCRRPRMTRAQSERAGGFLQAPASLWTPICSRPSKRRGLDRARRARTSPLARGCACAFGPAAKPRLWPPLRGPVNRKAPGRGAPRSAQGAACPSRLRRARTRSRWTEWPPQSAGGQGRGIPRGLRLGPVSCESGETRKPDVDQPGWHVKRGADAIRPPGVAKRARRRNRRGGFVRSSAVRANAGGRAGALIGSAPRQRPGRRRAPTPARFLRG